MRKVWYFITAASILAIAFILCQKNFSQSSKHLTSSEGVQKYVHVNNFIDHAMIRSYGIYSLFGFKPVTEIDISYSPIHEDFSSPLPWEVSTKTQWKAFNEELLKLRTESFFFTEINEDGFNSILFVHQPSLESLLSHYHFEFQQATGEDFDPRQKVQELKNGGSRFWKSVFSGENHYLMGLVFGYGEENSKLFEEEICGNKNLTKKRVEHTSIQKIKKLTENDISIKDLTIPQFISYAHEDEVVNKYEQLRKEIIKRFKNKNFSNEVFTILSEGSSKPAATNIKKNDFNVAKKSKEGKE